jgi:hypothetical protein
MSGAPEARYDLIADETETAAQEARQYLKRLRLIEVTCHPGAVFWTNPSGLAYFESAGTKRCSQPAAVGAD